MDTFIHGKNVLLEYLPEGGPDWVPFLCGKSCDITLTAELLKVTDTINGKFAAVIPVGVSGVMTTSGLIKYNLDNEDPVNLFLALSLIRVRFTINAEDGTVLRNLQSMGVIQTLNMSAGVFALAEQGLTIQLSGLIEAA